MCCFEKGVNALAGVYALDIVSWRTMKETLRELKKKEVQAKFDTVTIDTVAIAWDRCVEYICQKNGVEDLGDGAWGKLYKEAKKEFSNMFRDITMLGYGVIFLCHAEEKIPMGGKENDAYIAPMLEKRPYSIINGMVDIIACIDVDKVTKQRYLQLRSNERIFAGSRFKYMPDRIPLGYQELVDALSDAIEKEGAEKGNITDESRPLIGENERPFDQAMDEARAIWGQLVEKDGSDEMMDKIMEVIKKNFGEPIKLSTVKPHQQDLLELTILDLKDLL